MTDSIFASLIALLPVSIARKHAHKSRLSIQNEGPEPKQLLVDVSEIIQHDARSGIQRVVRGILLQLFTKPPAGYLVRPVFSERKHDYRYASISPDCLQSDENGRRNARQVVATAGDIFLGLDLAAHLVPRHQGQLLRWKRNGVQICFIVYDLLPLLHPYWFKPVRLKTFNRWIRTLAVYADDLICISATVKNDLHNWLSSNFGIQPESIRLHTIPLGADIEATMPSAGCGTGEQTVLDQLNDRHFILMVGTLEPRKGYAEALSAFELLWGEGQQVTLVIVGKRGWNTETLQERLRVHPERNKRLFWFDNASDELLERLYQAANGVLLASEAEGLGLPIIEALQHGKPVLARDITVFREISAPEVAFFNTNHFAKQLLAWIQLIQKFDRPHMIHRQTTWEESTASLSGILLRQRI